MPEKPPTQVGIQSPTSQALTSMSVNHNNLPEAQYLGSSAKQGSVTVPTISKIENTLSAAKHDHAADSIGTDTANISRMQGDFDERCARTK